MLKGTLFDMHADLFVVERAGMQVACGLYRVVVSKSLKASTAERTAHA